MDASHNVVASPGFRTSMVFRSSGTGLIGPAATDWPLPPTKCVRAVPPLMAPSSLYVPQRSSPQPKFPVTADLKRLSRRLSVTDNRSNGRQAARAGRSSRKTHNDRANPQDTHGGGRLHRPSM